MPKRIALLLTICLIAAAGCGGDDEEDAVESATTALTDTEGAESTLEEVMTEAEEALEGGLSLDLQEQNDSGISGTATFSPTSEGTVEVELELDGAEGEARPAHIHKGSCADLDPDPAFPLEDVVDGQSETTVDVDVTELTASEYAVNVHESAENIDTYVACADVRNQ